MCIRDRYYNQKIYTEDKGLSLLIEPNQEFALTYQDTINDMNLGMPINVIVQAEYYQTDSSYLQLVCRIGDYYSSNFTENTMPELNEWTKKQYQFKIPASYLNAGEVIKVYYFNPKKKKIFIDNYTLSIFQ